MPSCRPGQSLQADARDPCRSPQRVSGAPAPARGVAAEYLLRRLRRLGYLERDRVSGTLFWLSAVSWRENNRDSDPITYRWVQVDGPTVMRSNSTSAKPRSIAQPVSGTVRVTCGLTVSDGVLQTTLATVVITVKSAPPLDYCQPPRSRHHLCTRSHELRVPTEKSPDPPNRVNRSRKRRESMTVRTRHVPWS